MTALEKAPPRIAVLIPCFNEEKTIGAVVQAFARQLPGAEICVFDNNSQDATVSIAEQAGATVFYERRQGKGYVVQSMFRQVEADVYVMVDGDGTYPAEKVGELVAPILRHEADMVVGSRLLAEHKGGFKRVNRIGNALFLGMVNWLFRVRLTDVLSGYRAFSRQLVKSMPLFGSGFEIETELTIKALERGFRILELPVELGLRPPGSHSKIRTVPDGTLILNTILGLLRDYKPLTFFGSGALAFWAAGIIYGVLLLGGKAHPGSVALLVCFGLLLGGGVLGAMGLVLHTIARRFQELDFHLRRLEQGSSYTTRDRQEPRRPEG
jgi:glycosyltransferase involved in cell wall biosynthesis